MARARATITQHLLSSTINTAALWAVGGAIGNVLAGVAWTLAFTPVFVAPALAAGLIYGLSTMPVYVIYVSNEDK